MKKGFLLFCALVTGLLFACNKSDKPSMKFTVNGLSDITIGATNEYAMPISVNYTSGPQEKVSISVTGLPDGITAVTSPSDGIPSFTSTITFTSSIVAANGTYPAEVVVTTESGGKKTYDVNITLNREIFCNDFVEGYYTGTVIKNGGAAQPYSTYLVSYGLDGTRLSTGTVTMTINCDNYKIDIPLQGSSTTYQGSGTFTSPNKVHLEYTETFVSSGTANTYVIDLTK